MIRKLTILGIIVAVLIGVYLGISNTEYVHFKGDTVITAEQYVQVVAGHSIAVRAKWNYIELEGDNGGLVLFVYDFYVYDKAIDYNFLTQPVRGILDYPIFYQAGRGLKESFTEMWYVIPLFGIFGAVVYLTIKKPQHIWRLIKRIEHYIEGKYYSKIKETKGNVVTDVNTIKLKGNGGIICVRCWDVTSDGFLQSVGRETKWEKNELYADTTPDREGLSGVHAYRLGTYPHIKTKVIGIVELNGKYEYHVDGVVRAEHCKIFWLFMSKGYRRIGNYLSSKYGLPIYYDDNPEQGYLKWLYSKNGIEAINHNYEILKGD